MSTPAVTLRELRWTDIPVLAGLETALFGADAWSPQSWWGELAARPRRTYLVAVGGEEIVGYAGLDHSGEVADIMTLAVTPVARGRGLGRLLLGALESAASAGGAAYLMLEVRADNAAARALYDAAGFEQLTVRRRYYQPGDVDALVLRKSPRGAQDTEAPDGGDADE